MCVNIKITNALSVSSTLVLLKCLVLLFVICHESTEIQYPPDFPVKNLFDFAFHISYDNHKPWPREPYEYTFHIQLDGSMLL